MCKKEILDCLCKFRSIEGLLTLNWSLYLVIIFLSFFAFIADGATVCWDSVEKQRRFGRTCIGSACLNAFLQTSFVTSRPWPREGHRSTLGSSIDGHLHTYMQCVRSSMDVRSGRSVTGTLWFINGYEKGSTWRKSRFFFFHCMSAFINHNSFVMQYFWEAFAVFSSSPIFSSAPPRFGSFPKWTPHCFFGNALSLPTSQQNLSSILCNSSSYHPLRAPHEEDSIILDHGSPCCGSSRAKLLPHEGHERPCDASVDFLIFVRAVSKAAREVKKTCHWLTETWENSKDSVFEQDMLKGNLMHGFR